MSTAETGKDFVEHKVFKAKERESLAEKGQAMPGGGFPIRNQEDLKNAIMSFGRAKNKAAVKAWIIKRAKALELEHLLPEDWGSAEHMTPIRNFLEHHGVKGMRWGVRRSRRQLARSAGARKKKAVKEMSDDDLKKAVNRLNMEQQYSRLTSGRGGSSGSRKAVVLGSAFAGSIAMNVARQQITNHANTKVGEALARRAVLQSARKAGVAGVRAIGRTEVLK